MKKSTVLFLIFIMILILTACGKESHGTYYPDINEMKKNLEDKSYSVNDETIEQNNNQIIHLTASKGNEYIEFYRFDNDGEVDKITSNLEAKHNDYDRLVSMKNDDKFGNLAFCSTENAMNDAGIKITPVKIDIK